MSTVESIIGMLKMRSKVTGMPIGGLTVSTLRVELFEELTPDLAWIAELKILGKLPFNEGEERKVEVLIMTGEFEDYVVRVHPNLIVRHGSQVIGDLELV